MLGQPGFDFYLQKITEDGVWAGLPETNALARMFDVRIIIYLRSPTEPVCAVHTKAKKKTVALLSSGNHFDYFLPTTGSANSPVNWR